MVLCLDILDHDEERERAELDVPNAAGVFPSCCTYYVPKEEMEKRLEEEGDNVSFVKLMAAVR